MTEQLDRPLTTAPRGGSFTDVFSRALHGRPCSVVGLDDAPGMLPVGTWSRDADGADRAILALCSSPTLDIGCGPGRMAAALTEADILALGIDVVPAAVDQAVERGAPALQRDVFGSVPGEGTWATALLADGNVGIGGDPVLLLKRVAQLLAPTGRIVVEVAPPGVAAKTVWATLECDGLASSPFRWAVLGVDDIHETAAAADLEVTKVRCHGGRWVVVLEHEGRPLP